MIKLNSRIAVTALMILGIARADAAQPGNWSEPVEVRHDDTLSISYQARWDGPFLVIRATLGSGWHTFAMDNKLRAEEKLAGKTPLSIDRATEFTPAAGLEIAGPWLQSPPKDFSRPELRWFSWGFEGQALFVAKARRSGTAPVRIGVRGQACTETICKNIDVAIPLPSAADSKDTQPSEVNLKSLVAVR